MITPVPKGQCCFHSEADGVTDADWQCSMAQLENHVHQQERETGIELNDFKRISITASEDSVTMDLTKEEERGEGALTRPDLSVYASETPMHESMVFKIGGKNNLQRIQKRYFVLYPGMILYYHHRTNYARDKKHGLVSGART